MPGDSLDGGDGAAGLVASALTKRAAFTGCTVDTAAPQFWHHQLRRFRAGLLSYSAFRSVAQNPDGLHRRHENTCGRSIVASCTSSPSNRAALADLIMVQQGIAPGDPQARALMAAAGADPDDILAPP